MNVKPLFKLMVDKKASDLFFTTYAPVMIKIDGKIMPVNQVELTPKMVRQAALELMNETQLETFTRDLEIDFAISEAGLGRFRVNVFHQRGNVAMVLRFITPELPQLDQLGMPDILKDMIMLRRGLILMVGASGSGKSTTLAAMIDYRNKNSASHIVTIEDPIEFLHRDVQSSVTQREVGMDTNDVATGLKTAMRQDPDVIVLGDLPDLATLQGALRAADMGRLVISTMTAPDAAHAVDRLVGLYGAPDQNPARVRIVDALTAVIAQKLLPRAAGEGLAVAVEVLLGTPEIRDALRSKDAPEILPDLLAAGRERDGTQTFDQHLVDLVEAKVVRPDVARTAARRPESLPEDT
jgi:twitching motility protein PilU